MMWGWRWRPYVPAWKRQQQASKAMGKLRKKGMDVQPVVIEGRTIASTFWGRAWCEHLEKFSDFENRLPRGRAYARNGSVCHLDIRKGHIAAKVSGSSLYDVTVSIKTLPNAKWKRVRNTCAGQVGSILDLLRGNLSERVMGIVMDRTDGLFPSPKEIDFDCSCPDWADMCKHIAAVLYGVGARLDKKPELLFLLRGVDHNELVSEDAARAVVARSRVAGGRRLDGKELADVFGIDLAKTSGAKSKTRNTIGKPPARKRADPKKKGNGRR